MPFRRLGDVRRSIGFGGPAPEEMPFLDHLEELRFRLLWSVAAIAIGTAVGWIVVTRFDVLGILSAPIQPYLNGGKLIVLSPYDPFFLTLRLAVLSGVLLALPVIVYHLWSFLSPALLPSERRIIIPSLYLGLGLFVAGVVMAYKIVLPMTLRFTMSFQTESLTPAITATEYLGAATRLLVAFGAVFELPVVLTVLAAMGVVTPQFLASKRRHAFVAITILSSLLTPGDVISVTVMMMIPLFLLYELSIVLARLVTRGRDTAVAAGAEG